MRTFLRNLTLAILALAPPAAFAGEGAWTPIPLVESQRIPGQWLLTRDSAVSYALAPFTSLQRSDDGGRHWAHLPLASSPAAVEVDPFDAETLFMTSYGFLQRSTDGGRSWAVGWPDPQPGFGAPVMLVSRHFRGRVYVANEHALWQSADGGVTFALRGDLAGGANAEPVVALEEAADGGLYVRRADRCGYHSSCPDWRIDRSADQGQSWIALQHSASPPGPKLVRMIAHPSRPESVYFLQGAEAGNPHLLLSDDRGATTADRGPLPADGALLTDPASPDTLYLAGRNTLHRSLDRGASWQEVALPAGPAGLDAARFALASPGRLAFYALDYLAAPPPESSDTYASSDGGASWSAVQVEGPFLGWATELATSGPEGTLYCKHQGSLSRSTDGGASWQTFPVATRLTNLVGDPLDSGTLYAVGLVGEVEGILRSRDGGQSFSLVYGPPNLPYVSGLVAFARGGATTVVAALGSDLARSADGGNTWTVGPPQVVGASGQTWLRRLIFDGSTLLRRRNLPARALRFDRRRRQLELARRRRLQAGWRRRRVGPAERGRQQHRLDQRGSRLAGLPATVSRDLGGQLPEFAGRRQRRAFYLQQVSVLLRGRDRGQNLASLVQDLPIPLRRRQAGGRPGRPGSPLRRLVVRPLPGPFPRRDA